jgi:hypothetical protein
MMAGSDVFTSEHQAGEQPPRRSLHLRGKSEIAVAPAATGPAPLSDPPTVARIDLKFHQVPDVVVLSIRDLQPAHHLDIRISQLAEHGRALIAR